MERHTVSMLDELVAQISQRTGLPQDKAQEAARTAVEFPDARLPPPIGGTLAKLVHGGGAGGGGLPDLGGLAGGLGGLFEAGRPLGGDERNAGVNGRSVGRSPQTIPSVPPRDFG
jgi:hypothetical protein